ncbi:MAG: ribosome small subunit-dependent GTPase A [Clostridia bacterium]|nr:ribosome small subunit-dependent GTPase A [Clostridia bacterium]
MNSTEIKAMVIAVHKERYALYDETNGEYYGKLKSSNYHYAQLYPYPVTGDYVICQHNPLGDSVILETLERKSFIQRFDAWSASNAQAIAANVDEIFILTSANHDFNLKRLHRYLAACRQENAHCTILITKADTAEDIDAYLLAAKSDMPDVEVIAISAKTGWQLDKVKEKMKPGKVSVFLGSSGVGKSTLVNALAGREVMDVNGIREDDSKGRHTTTHRQMIFLDNGAMVIDVPGMRELALLDAQEGLNRTFRSVSELEKMCRFSDCKHQNEPGCAVRAALENGSLTQKELDEFKTLQKEAKRIRRDRDIMVSKYRKEMRKTPKGRR